MGGSVDPQPEMAKGSAKEVSYSILYPKQQECNQGHVPGVVGRFACKPTFCSMCRLWKLAHLVIFGKSYKAEMVLSIPYQ
jgi:hypothetical protein